MAAIKGLFGRLKAADGELFTKTDPAIDGEDCTHDCGTCSVHLPNKWSIDEADQLYGHIKGFNRHIIVATGKTDWIRDVGAIKGSVMEAIDSNSSSINNGRLMLSASNMPTDSSHTTSEDSTRCILLPAFLFIDNVTPSAVPDLISGVINSTSTNVTSLTAPSPNNLSIPEGLTVRACPHDYLILLCSHKTRDARCGQSAPLIRKELERHLRPLGLLRDLHDERPGGVGIYFISHVGGHKYSANMMIYRKAGTKGLEIPEPTAETGDAGAQPVGVEKTETNGGVGNGHVEGQGNGSAKKEKEVIDEAGQCIWLARIKPEDCENIVRYTILQGKVVKPESQLRGGFDRCKQLASW
ncbi:actin patches distal protein [Microthyrium microscopicum]|uniref:Actin patches distal protein n=1 Tax=Microthyrium microscopicum TaxID=703497 RepID=A0A6A6URJ2_9PEZI|nr:actin patches distal protein [Microthyrium microscopicum]